MAAAYCLALYTACMSQIEIHMMQEQRPLGSWMKSDAPQMASPASSSRSVNAMSPISGIHQLLHDIQQICVHNVMSLPSLSISSLVKADKLVPCWAQILCHGNCVLSCAGGKYGQTISRVDTGRHRGLASAVSLVHGSNVSEGLMLEMSEHCTPPSQGSQAASSREDPF